MNGVEWAKRYMPPDNRPIEVEPGVFTGNWYTYQDAVLVSDLLSGKDGPYAHLADQLCSLNREW